MSPRLPRLIGPIALTFVILSPAITWMAESLREDKFVSQNPYSIGDIHLAFIISLLIIIIEMLNLRQSTARIGDESKIILNRNETDYYEIWEEVRAHRDIKILAVGHSFNTLWFNFIKKFLNEVVSNERHWTSVEVRLISSHRDPGSYHDIRRFHGALEMHLARKITFHLSSVPSEHMFFTGLCVNNSALWLSIREPHRTVKLNEHVREWRRSAGGSAEKMVNWYIGVAEYLESLSSTEVLQAVASPDAPRSA